MSGDRSKLSDTVAGFLRLMWISKDNDMLISSSHTTRMRRKTMKHPDSEIVQKTHCLCARPTKIQSLLMSSWEKLRQAHMVSPLLPSLLYSSFLRVQTRMNEKLQERKMTLKKNELNS
ncbi:hypothetical protein I310_01328 [Cryptococcus deuterogattii CA1014]|nr:hypothetical protein I310_01328 [Cryptococcus deuterogattii CA1014]